MIRKMKCTRLEVITLVQSPAKLLKQKMCRFQRSSKNSAVIQNLGKSRKTKKRNRPSRGDKFHSPI